MPVINTWLRLHGWLHKQAIEARGFSELHPGTPDAIRWPHTTGLDVIAIAAVFDPYIQRTTARAGERGVVARWRVCVAELRDALAAPREPYPHNRSFWDALARACAFLHVEGVELPALPLLLGLLQQLRPDLRRNRGPSGTAPFADAEAETFHDLYLAQYQHLRAARGADRMSPEPGMPGVAFDVPRTTHADVIVLADYWGRQLADTREINGDKGIRERWRVARTDVDDLARKGEPGAVYAKNNAFWRALGGVARQVSTADEAPTQTEVILTALGETAQALPGRLADAAKSVAGTAGSALARAGKAAGDLGHDVARGLLGGLFGELRTPLIVGGVGLGVLGLYLLTRAPQPASVS